METGSRGYFLSFSALTHQIPTVEGKRIRCVRQKRSIKRNIELPVAIHEVRDGQRSRCLSSPIETFRFEDENDYEYEI